MKKLKLIFKPVFIIFIVFVLFFSFFDFIYKTNNLSTNRVLEHLEDIGKQEANNFNQQFENLQNKIKNVSTIIENGFQSEDDIIKILEIVKNDKNYFKRLWYVDKQKEFHNYKDNITINSNDDFIDDMFNGKSGVTDVYTSSFNKKDIVSIYSPIFKDKKVIGGVVGVIEINNENEDFIYNDVFNDQAYAYMTSTNGEIISKIKNENSLYFGYNYFDFLKSDVEFSIGDYKEVNYNIFHMKSGFIKYSFNNNDRMAYYTPVGINNWYIFTIVTTDVISAQNSEINNITLFLILKLLFVVSIVFYFIIRYFIKINKINKETHKKLIASHQKIDMVLKQISDRIFEYDIKNDSLTLDAWNEYPKIMLNHFLANIHNYNFVCKEDEKLFREKFKMIGIENNKIEFDAKLPYISKDYETWYHISMIYDNDSNNAVGTLKNSTKEMKEYLSLLEDNMFKNSIYSEALFMFAINMKNKKVVIYQENGSYHNVIDVDYDEYLINLLTLIHKSDKEKVKDFFNYDFIIKNYYEKEKSSKIEFRYLNKELNKYYWIRCRINFERQSSNNELVMIVYSNDIDEEKKKQLEIEFKAKRDGLTALYNKETFNKLVEKYIKKNNQKSNYCAYLIVDLDNFKKINDNLGHSIGDKVIIKVSEILENIFGYNGYVGRFGGDEFVVFLYRQESYAIIENKVRESLDLIKEIEINEKYCVSASIGLRFVGDEKTNQELFDKADKALYVAKDNGKKMFQVYFDGLGEK